jgi:NAD-dependent deacetylase
MESLEEKIRFFANLIIKSENIIALTGAGMSTESGIPDFRSPNTGLWTKYDPDEIASIDSYISNASKNGKNLEFMLEMGKTIFMARPNSGHKALTKLQKLGKLAGVLTQNIDRLHQKAKTKNVVELHGNVNEAICMSCRTVYPITTMINQVLKEYTTPYCTECNGLLKPNAIFFGEALEAEVITKADAMIGDCDLLIILGSSLLVYPAAFYPHKAYANGAKIAIINNEETGMDNCAEVVIHDNIGTVFPKVIDIVEKSLKP